MLHTLLYVGIGMIGLLVGIIVFALITPKISERKEIFEQGNVPIAVQYVGKVMGLTIGIWASASFSVSVKDYLLWTGFAIVAQVVVYWVIEHIIYPKVSFMQKMKEGNLAIAILLAGISVAVGVIIAGSLSYDQVLDLLTH